MLSWLFKKRKHAGAPRAAAAVPDNVRLAAELKAELSASRAADAKLQAAAHAHALGTAQLQSALGDDAALLQLAQTTPLLQIKLAAVQALAGEAALKQAERAFRSHDRKVHRAAKQRLEGAVAQREARAKARALLDAATLMSAEARVPANRLVALDSEWQALAAALLEPAQHSAFQALREQLNAALRAQAALEKAQFDAAQQPPAPAPAPEAATEAATEAAPQPVAPAPAPSAAPARPTPEPPPPPQRPTAAQLQTLDSQLQQAEAALAEGQLAALQGLLHALEASLAALHGAALDGARRARWQALQAERARLAGWQQWGSARAREDLVDAAEALSRLTLAAAQPEAPKLQLKAHGEALHGLRKRWKELDRSGAAAPQALWQRFDAALQAAHAPLAAQHAAIQAARQDNLAAREALLAALDAVPSPVASAAAEPHADASADVLTEAVADTWKEPVRALERFQAAWRQLGPLEHTVPGAAREALQRRWRSSVERLEQPLSQARRAAQAVREQFIARAEALAPERDAVLRLRELQAEWQQHARTLPLVRAVEEALWTRFKAATDAVFAQRAAAFSARDAEAAANLAVREALLQRLSELGAETPEADQRRTLAEVDRAWRQAGEAPRHAAAALEARLQEAHAAVLAQLSAAAQRRWQAQCNTLVARLALCEERECVAGVADEELAQRWATCDSVPGACGQALAQRWAGGVQAGPLPEAAFDDVLLQLEVLLALPASPEQQAARRALKLRAMKDALESRRAAHAVAPQRDALLAAALRQAGITAAQRQRLHALLAAWQAAPPDAALAPA